MVMPGVVALAVPPAPPPPFFEHPEHPHPSDESSANADRTRYKYSVFRVLRVCSLAFLTFALVCSTGLARANGRFPAAQAIVTVPRSDGATLFLRATFGILVSRDGCKSWRWMCERALGYEGTWDPPIAATRDGRLWIGLERGLSSTLDGCLVEPATELTGETIKDLTTDPSGDTIWALTGAPDRRGAIWRKTGAAKFERLGPTPEGFNPMTLEIAPSKPSRVYVSGQTTGTIRGQLLYTDDGGKTYVGGKNDLVAEGPFFIADVDPKNADRVLVRQLHTTGSDILLSTDAGKTLSIVLTMKSGMYGFAKSADGSTYWAGSGLPEHGIFQSKDRGAHFEHVSGKGVLCLAAAPDGRLLVCENPLTKGAPAVSVSTDEGKTVTPLAMFADVQGPVSCAGPNVCTDAWPETRALLAPRDAGPAVAAAPTARGSTCGCTVVGNLRDTPDHVWLTTGLLPLFVWGRARRRRGSRQSQSGPSRPTARPREP
ncbi:hypothetical protein BH11MYX4_BH11MYX4_43940 [soil metagenome]